MQKGIRPNEMSSPLWSSSWPPRHTEPFDLQQHWQSGYYNSFWWDTCLPPQNMSNPRSKSYVHPHQIPNNHIVKGNRSASSAACSSLIFQLLSVPGEAMANSDQPHKIGWWLELKSDWLRSVLRLLLRLSKERHFLHTGHEADWWASGSAGDYH